MYAVAIGPNAKVAPEWERKLMSTRAIPETGTVVIEKCQLSLVEQRETKFAGELREGTGCTLGNSCNECKVIPEKGYGVGSTAVLWAYVAGSRCEAPLDTGASESFIISQTVDRLELKVQRLAEARMFTMAKGEQLRICHARTPREAELQQCVQKTPAERAYDLLAKEVASMPSEEAVTLLRPPPERYTSHTKAGRKIEHANSHTRQRILETFLWLPTKESLGIWGSQGPREQTSFSPAKANAKQFHQCAENGIQSLKQRQRKQIQERTVEALVELAGHLSCPACAWKPKGRQHWSAQRCKNFRNRGKLIPIKQLLKTLHQKKQDGKVNQLMEIHFVKTVEDNSAGIEEVCAAVKDTHMKINAGSAHGEAPGEKE
ncbi:hypothetical protein EBH_0072930 [Eimeria brunetti]|uniref:Uncharacterized protein n=1 Tax=Eimeria brunetti TaxID=51314 RepID=U6LFX8_9EIME|nr:hypothetical protein EBH_0072930 [Eimeria brunetti]